MSTIAVAITVTWTGGFTKSTLPATTPGGSARTMATTDGALPEFAEQVRKEAVRRLFSGIDPNANVNTTVAVTVT